MLDQSDIGAGVISIMEPDHAEWVGDAHEQFPDRILPAMIVNPLNGYDEIRKVVDYYERYGIRCLRIPPFRYELSPTDRVYWPFGRQGAGGRHLRVNECLACPVSAVPTEPRSAESTTTRSPITSADCFV